MNVAPPREYETQTSKGVGASHAGMDRPAPRELEVTLLTGGFDRPYAYGLAKALSSRGVSLDVIGSDELDGPEMHSSPKLNFINLHGKKRDSGLAAKVSRVLIFYWRLLRYAAGARQKVFHILWQNSFPVFDRTLLMAYYKLLGKKIVFTAHNVNAGRRDGNDSLLNRLSLKIQYELADHIFVHTEQMTAELSAEFGIQRKKVTVIPFGINNAVPHTDLTPAEAKRRLGVGERDKTVLFFGNIRPYKGLEHLVAAFQRVAAKDESYRLIIAGEVKKTTEQYMREIQEAIDRDPSKTRVLQALTYVPDEETELYFKAADVLVLPYTVIYQSGVLFLGYSFGLPAIATDVGSLREDIVEGKTGFLARSYDPEVLALAIETFFDSDLYKTLDRRRAEIQEYARARNSWEVVADTTCKVYAELLRRRKPRRGS